MSIFDGVEHFRDMSEEKPQNWINVLGIGMSTRRAIAIRANVIGREHIVVGGDVGIDRLVADLEDAPDAAADRQGPAIIVISFPVGGNEGTRGQVPALREVIIEEGLQRHGIHVGAVIISSKGPEVQDQEAGCYV